MNAMNVTELLIGADPEVFLRDGHMLISAHDFPCGTKESPKATSHGTVQVDGMALEFNIEPASTREKFVGHVVQMKQDLVKEVKKHNPLVSIEYIPVAKFGVGYLATLPKEVLELGCNQDFNAYTMDANPPPDASQNIRTAAGHIHLGWTKDQDINDAASFVECASLARELDFRLGLPSLKWDCDSRRRSMYGKAGSFRVKPYGMEYRVLSNVWVRSVRLMAQVYTLTEKTYKEWRRGNLLYKDYGKEAQTYIDKNVLDWPTFSKELAEIVNAD